jgi:hypothetical protein
MRLPSLLAMRTVTAFTVVFLFETLFLLTAQGVMIIFCIRFFLTSCRIYVGRTVLLSTSPTPSSTTSLAYMKLVLEIEATCKYISTGRIFQRPSLTPGTSLSVIRTGFWHSIEWVLKGLCVGGSQFLMGFYDTLLMIMKVL